MNRLFMWMCMAALFLCHTSCQEGTLEENGSGEVALTRAVDSNAQHLIQQARTGEVDAYLQLAVCYRDGNGVGAAEHI